MPVYTFRCTKCKHTVEEVHPLSEYDSLKAGLPCPKCKHSTLRMIISPVAGVLTGNRRERHKLRHRFDKRNKRLESMPQPQQERMKWFMRKMQIKKDHNG